MDSATEAGFRRSPFWVVVLLGLAAGQGWLSLAFFDADRSLSSITDDRPVLDGRHPLHHYHALLGNRAWHERQSVSCYDPAFNAGYLKTPLFDGGSRPAELAYLIGGPTARSYKIGLLVCCVLVPIGFALAARGIGLPPAGSCLAALVGGTLWWSHPTQSMLVAGHVDLLTGGLFLPAYLGWLARYHRQPGPVECLTLAGCAAIVWFTQPMLMLGATGLALLLHLWAFRSMRFAWHLGLLSANAAAVGVNAIWLRQWVKHAPLFSPSSEATTTTPFEDWQVFLPGDPVDVAILSLGGLGLLWMLGRQGVAAILLVSAAGSCAVIGASGRMWPTVAELGGERLTTVAVWCAALPATYLLCAVAGGIGSSAGFRPMGFVWLVVALLGATLYFDLPHRFQTTPLALGWSGEREEVVRVLREKTTPDGRILWEDRKESDDGWCALLPERTQRHFVGGLSPDVAIDHLHARLVDGDLVGRAIAEWSDDELGRFLTRYNVTRIVARSVGTRSRLGRWKGAAVVAEFPGDAGTLFALDRPTTYFLKGEGTVTQMDWKRVALMNVEPDAEGVIVLSLHHHPNWRVTPGHVAVEREVDIADPVPMVRLRLSAPASRVTLTWVED